jgi:DNA repair protein RecO (recombination protein O)
MSRTYRAIGINLKSSPMGESDRLLTILTPERGLLKVAAPGARKQNATLGGRSGLFIINDMLIAEGKSLDRLTQAETLESYPKLSRDLGKLTAGQYLVEIALEQAIAQHPQAELYYLLTEHLGRIEAANPNDTLACLTHGVYQLLALAGLAPQVQQCCLSGKVLDSSLPMVGFSIEAGGVLDLAVLAERLAEAEAAGHGNPTRIALGLYAQGPVNIKGRSRSPKRPLVTLGPVSLEVMQQLAQAKLPEIAVGRLAPEEIQQVWRGIEGLLRHYAQFHLERPIRSAALIDTCFPQAIQTPT